MENVATDAPSCSRRMRVIARPMPLEGIASNQRVVEEVIEGGKHFEAPVTRTTGFLAMSNDVCALDGLFVREKGSV